MLLHLLLVQDDTGSREFILDQTLYSIGRDSRCTIRLVSQFVSRRHATLIQQAKEDGTYYYQIVDGTLKGKPSANGLLINGRKLQTHILQAKDKIVFGPQVSAIYYRMEQDALEELPIDELAMTVRRKSDEEEFEH